MQVPVPPVMTPWSLDASGLVYSRSAVSMADAASAVWTTASQALFLPFVLTMPALATKMIVYNGATVSGNLDVGIYDRVGTRLVSSGSVAQAGTNAGQEMDLTDTVIGPGFFYMALVLDNITGTFFRGASAAANAGGLIQSSAFVLPATATFAVYSIGSYVPVMGVVFDKTLT